MTTQMKTIMVPVKLLAVLQYVHTIIDF